ncbi:hypothetical protein [Clostridium saccharobutylicum]|uniref:Uncharacterized protein n=1 Tax=Clostridium saccharobutylicum TaxID=169679 RepID=A0A1S8NJF4_CLOSA|nr:hypothetical protein [Clostridium saccharobutylicum]OOM16371.1 hypothetical protein CLOSAC_06420 [Clostridium saccharobutylicum]
MFPETHLQSYTEQVPVDTQNGPETMAFPKTEQEPEIMATPRTETKEMSDNVFWAGESNKEIKWNNIIK